MKKMARRLFSRMGIVSKLTLSYVLLILIPFLTYTVLSNGYVSEHLLDQFRFSSDMSLSQTGANLERLMRDLVNASGQLAYNRQLSEIALQNPSKALVNSYPSYSDVSGLVKTVLYFDEIYSVELYTGGRYAAREPSGTAGFSLLSLDGAEAKELTLRLTAFRGDLLWLGPSSRGTEEVLSCARYLRSTTTHRIIGILAVHLRQSAISGIMADAAIQPGSLTLLLDSDGTLLSISKLDPSENLLDTAEIFHCVQNKEEKVNVTGVPYMCTSHPLSGTGWTLVSLTPYSEMLKTTTALRRHMMLLMAVISSLFFGVAYVTSRVFTRQLRQLTHRVSETRLGVCSPLPSSGGTREIDVLIEGYNHMLGKINDYAHTQYMLGLELKNSELKALQAQINPHFLYNMLDLINWLALDYGATDISEVVSLLSRFYRLSLSGGAEEVPVGDAIQHIEVYVRLQNLRFGNSIHLQVDAAPEVYACRVLKLLLQPIVENAILHGVRETESQSGQIALRAWREGGDLLFEVIDDGVGMTKDHMRRLLCEESGGYGVKNVAQRIRLFYGEKYSLSYQSAPGRGTCARLRLPAWPIR